MSKTVTYGTDDDEGGRKYTTVQVHGEDCMNAKDVLEEIENIVRDDVQSTNPTAFYRHLIVREYVEADGVEIRVRGDFIDAFLTAGYEIG